MDPCREPRANQTRGLVIAKLTNLRQRRRQPLAVLPLGEVEAVEDHFTATTGQRAVLLDVSRPRTASVRGVVAEDVIGVRSADLVEQLGDKVATRGQLLLQGAAPSRPSSDLRNGDPVRCHGGKQRQRAAVDCTAVLCVLVVVVPTTAVGAGVAAAVVCLGLIAVLRTAIRAGEAAAVVRRILVVVLCTTPAAAVETTAVVCIPLVEMGCTTSGAGVDRLDNDVVGHRASFCRGVLRAGPHRGPRRST